MQLQSPVAQWVFFHYCRDILVCSFTFPEDNKTAMVRIKYTNVPRFKLHLPCYFAGFRNRPNHFLKPGSFCKGSSAPSLHLHATNKLGNVKSLVMTFLVEAKLRRTLWKANTSYVLWVRWRSPVQQSNFLPKWYTSFDIVGDSDLLESDAFKQSHRQYKLTQCWDNMFFWVIYFSLKILPTFELFI